MQPIVISLMVSIHLVEVAVMATRRLKPHGVPTFSSLWWTWTVSTFIEGFGAFQRFDKIVQEEKAKKEQAKSN
jgi:hypothetical protein